MQIGFSVRLPGDAHSLPLMRALCRQALEHLGVAGTTVDEITLALSEACANAVQHAGGREDYEVEMQIDDVDCRISVLDRGAGLPATATGDGGGSPDDDGSGLILMRALVDDLDFRLDPDGRHRVTLVKHLGLVPRTVTPSASLAIMQRRMTSDRLWDRAMRTQFPVPKP